MIWILVVLGCLVLCHLAKKLVDSIPEAEGEYIDKDEEKWTIF